MVATRRNRMRKSKIAKRKSRSHSRIRGGDNMQKRMNELERRGENAQRRRGVTPTVNSLTLRGMNAQQSRIMRNMNISAENEQRRMNANSIRGVLPEEIKQRELNRRSLSINKNRNNNIIGVKENNNIIGVMNNNE